MEGALALSIFSMKVWVKDKDQTFIVNFDEEGEVRSIKQRKVHAPGKPWECWYNAPYWHHSMNLGGPKSRPRRIIEQAKLKRLQEEEHG